MDIHVFAIVNSAAMKIACMQSFSRVWLCDTLERSLPGSSVYGTFQARIL